MSRPELLYRGTPSKNVDLFVPKEKVGTRIVVSASPARTFATMFVVPIEDLKVKFGSVGDYRYYLCADENKFRQMDKGGAIYTFSTDGFEQAPITGEDVWINPEPVIPIAKEDVSSALEAMIQAGVKVYFVSDETLDRFRTFPENREIILQSLVSENTKYGNKDI